MSSELVTAKELAAEAGVTVGRIHQLLQEGRIKSTRVGERVLVITRQEANRYLAERQREANQ
jgi:excisionase family DNA binding protein